LIRRPDQLILQDDPAFLPDLAFRGFDIDLSALDLSSDATSHRSSILSQRSQQSSRSSHHERDASPLGLVIPTSETGATADIGGFVIPGADGGSAQRGNRLRGPILEGDEEGFFPDVDFELDAEGNVIEFSAEEKAQRRSAAGAGGSRLSRDSAASGRVRREHEEGLQAFAQLEVRYGCLKGASGSRLTMFSLDIHWTLIWRCLTLATTTIFPYQKLSLFLRWHVQLHLMQAFSNHHPRHQKKKSLPRSLRKLHCVPDGKYQRY